MALQFPSRILELLFKQKEVLRFHAPQIQMKAQVSACYACLRQTVQQGPCNGVSERWIHPSSHIEIRDQISRPVHQKNFFFWPRNEKEYPRCW